MSRPPVEVADILRVQGDCFREQNRAWLGYQQLNVLRAISACRTAVMIELDVIPERSSAALKNVEPERSSDALLVFVGGTADTAARMLNAYDAAATLHVAALRLPDLEDLLRLTESLALGQRKQLHGLPDFRADIMLLLGGVLIVFAVFLAPTVLRLHLGRNAKAMLLAVAGVLIAYGIILTVVPTVWTPFAAKFTMPNTGWKGVFRVAIFFDAIAAVLAFFVLRRMKAPVRSDVAGEAPQLIPAKVRGVA